MAPTVICVSHLAGAQGEQVARLVAEQLGFRYVDDEIIMAAAAGIKAFPEAVAFAESRHPKRMIEVDFNRFEHVEMLRELIRSAVRAVAEEGRVVIVAHAAAFALSDRADVLRVLVVGSEDTRRERLAGPDTHDRGELAKQLKESDKNRAAYLKHFYGVRSEHAVNYDLVINTDRLAPEQGAAAVVRAVTHEREV